MQGAVLLPESAPANRTKIIEDFGLEVERMPTDRLMDGVARVGEFINCHVSS